ncbi:Cytochrome P450-like protein E-class [Orpheovirus IHUMI-LCC2]|uniref:Cytochrome P450-like protein E-class n=1 Tax=Orpheovirus IHUMI-LCC2 TaxID=2023057 RepID=A0A2I2L481_9VIRU|nr:Cytochrome P450-like protein E-class [Orpheovirus IHUMI-LCC2]SNW62334.1 Cytochrome P450-like protein E-class [Orpheovirus IHUMI-LCC2]
MIFIILFIACILGITVYIKNTRKVYKIFTGPPSDSYILGNTKKILKDLIYWHKDWIDKYSSNGFVYYRLIFGLSRLIVCNIEGIKHILVTNVDNYQKPKAGVGISLGQGLVFMEGELHRSHKKIIQPSFKHNEIINMYPKFIKCTNNTINKWNDKINEGSKLVVDINEEMIRLTIEILCSTIFGGNMNIHNNEELYNNFNIIMKYFDLRPQLFIPGYGKLPTSENIEFKKALSNIHTMLFKIIEDKKSDKLDDGDMIDSLLKYQDEDMITTEQLIGHIITFFIAGHETTALALTWAFECLSQHEDIKMYLLKEIENIKDDGDITYENVKNMKYLNNFIKEVLRFYSPVPVTHRQCIKEDIVNGKIIPEGTIIDIPIAALNKSTKYWDNPDKFDPERWTKIDDMSNYLYMPFLAGSRSCIGNKFAIEEIKIVLIKLLSKFTLTLPENYKYGYKVRITSRPDPSIKMFISLR